MIFLFRLCYLQELQGFVCLDLEVRLPRYPRSAAFAALASSFLSTLPLVIVVLDRPQRAAHVSSMTQYPAGGGSGAVSATLVYPVSNANNAWGTTKVLPAFHRIPHEDSVGWRAIVIKTEM